MGEKKLTWRLPEVRLKDGHAGTIVRKGDVDQLVKTTGPGGRWFIFRYIPLHAIIHQHIQRSKYFITARPLRGRGTELLDGHHENLRDVYLPLFPHLMMAESMMSGLLVAPMMNTFFLAPIPSISVRIWLITLSEAPPGNQKYNKKSIKLTHK